MTEGDVIWPKSKGITSTLENGMLSQYIKVGVQLSVDMIVSLVAYLPDVLL